MTTKIEEYTAALQMAEETIARVKREAREYVMSKFKHGQVIIDNKYHERRAVYLIGNCVSVQLHTHSDNKAHVCVLTYPITKSGRPAKIGYSWVDVETVGVERNRNGEVVVLKYEE